MTKYFHLSIIWNGPAKSVELLTPIFDLADDWITYGGSNWIVYTSEDLVKWSGRIRAVISDADSFFICEIADITETDGWLQMWVWEWIHKSRDIIGRIPNESSGLLPPYTE